MYKDRYKSLKAYWLTTQKIRAAVNALFTCSLQDSAAFCAVKIFEHIN